MGHQVLCFGDSNTYGYDPRSYMGERYPEAVRWTALLNTAGWAVTNEGENGRCIPRLEQAAKVLIQAVRHAEAEIVVVMLESNDLLQQPTPSAENCTERMERFLTAFLKEKPSSCEVLLIAPPPMELGAWVSDPKTLEESRRLTCCYEALAQRLGLHFADAGIWEVGLAFDGVHFSDMGHRAFAVGIQKTLKQIVSEAD